MTTTLPNKEQVEEQLTLLAKDKANFPKLRIEFLRRLCAAEFAGKFDDEKPNQCARVVDEAWVAAHSNPKKRRQHDDQAPTRLVREAIVPALQRHYQNEHATGTVVIALDAVTFRPRFSWGEGSQPPPIDTLDRFRGRFHRYHLTAGERESFWIYSILNIDERIDRGGRGVRGDIDRPDLWLSPRLRGRAHALDAEYDFEARLSGEHLHMLFQRSAGGSDSGFELYPFAISAGRQDTFPGIMIMQTRAAGRVASSAVILCRNPIPALAQITPGQVPPGLEHHLERIRAEGHSIFHLPEPELFAEEGFPSTVIASRIGSCGVCRLCVTWHPMLKSWESELRKALRAGAHISVILAHPESAFTRLRSGAIYRDGHSLAARREIEDNRATLRQLRQSGQLEVNKTFDALPVAYVEIDGTLYFSAWWIDRRAAEGFWFSTRTNSATGTFLKDQFDKLLAHAPVDNLEEAAADAPEGDIDPAFLAALREYNVWVGTMEDVYSNPKERRPGEERVTLRVEENHDGNFSGQLECHRNEETVVLLLRNYAPLDRHVSFSYRNEDPAIRHVGSLLLELDNTGTTMTGFYLGWSPRRSTHHCCALQLRAVESAEEESVKATFPVAD